MTLKVKKISGRNLDLWKERDISVKKGFQKRRNNRKRENMKNKNKGESKREITKQERPDEILP